MSAGDSLLRDLLTRRDPHGYYVIPAKPEAAPLLEGYLRRPGVVVVEYIDMILVKTRSRSLAARLARALARRGLLAVEETA